MMIKKIKELPKIKHYSIKTEKELSRAYSILGIFVGIAFILQNCFGIHLLVENNILNGLKIALAIVGLLAVINYYIGQSPLPFIFFTLFSISFCSISYLINFSLKGPLFVVTHITIFLFSVIIFFLLSLFIKLFSKIIVFIFMTRS